jgi:hypothetical protein
MDHAEPTCASSRCTSCGAQFVVAPAVIAATCAWCGSKLVDAAAAPAVDRMVPFRITARMATARLRDRLAGAFWAPREIRRVAKRGAIAPEELRGVLVPHFVYRASTRARWRARIGIDWWRTERRRDREGKEVRERVRHTEWFDSDGTMVGAMEHPECASAILTAAECRALRPFDLGRAVAFDPRLTAGFGAELPTRSRAEVDREARRAITRLELERLARRILPGDHRDVVGFECDVTLGTIDVVLLPVWVVRYRWQGAVHRMLVHGQDGSCVGQAPVSSVKVAIAVLLSIAIAWLLWWASRGGAT